MKGRPQRTRTDNEKEKKLNRRDVVIRNADARIGRQELQKQEPRQRRWIRRCVALRGREQRVETLGVLTTERKRKKSSGDGGTGHAGRYSARLRFASPCPLAGADRLSAPSSASALSEPVTAAAIHVYPAVRFTEKDSFLWLLLRVTFTVLFGDSSCEMIMRLSSVVMFFSTQRRSGRAPISASKADSNT